MELYGKKITKKTISSYVGDISQIADAKESVMTSGKADGVRVIDVKTGSGLCFTVVPSRCLDIGWAEYKGMPLALMSKSGMTNPAFFEKDGLSFLRNFFCGLMTTCGLTYFGAPCVDEGEKLGLHGRVGNIPAQDVSVQKEWEGDDYVIRIRGRVQQSSIFFENLVLTREIVVRMGGKTIQVHDRVENCGFTEQPFMLMYHCNFGYPLVSEDTTLHTSKTTVTTRDAEAEQGLGAYASFQTPVPGFAEQVFYHDMQPAADGSIYACLFNNKLGLGAYVKSNKNQLNYLVEWKMMGAGDYVVGLEPATWKPEGRAEARRRGELLFIQPGEIKEFNVEFGILESLEEIKNI
ncbi:MAG: aldose 1-epimerase family protein [Eubacteriales bacterium]